VAVVSETTARRLWPDGDAIGRIVRLQVSAPGTPRESRAPEPAFRPYTVVGVTRDVNGTAVFKFLSFSGIYLPIDQNSPGTSLTVRVHGDPEQARRALVERLTRVDPALDHEVRTRRTLAGLGTYLLQVIFAVTCALGGLALALTASGLFSVLSYLVEQRSREIGVRVALGATTRQVAGLVLSQSVVPVGVGLLIGGGLAAAVATALISVASEIGRTVHVLDPMAYAASLLVIVIACLLAAAIPTLRAARLDPVATLRQD
jgi:ABC-type lipoprotein release transport system permease subunit